MAARVFVNLLAFIVWIAYSANQPQINYKHSFQPPFDTAKVPEWHPSATVHIGPPEADRVKLTPFHGVKFGTFWNVIRSLMTDWEVFAVFDLNAAPEQSQQERGAGLGLWYASTPGVAGPVCGSADFWNGLGIFFQPSYPRVKVTAVVNDETQQYMTWQKEDTPDALVSRECTVEYGVTTALSVLVRYNNNTLSVWVVPDVSNPPLPNKYNSPFFGPPCLSIENADLGIDKYFGMTAYSHHKEDQYDLLRFIATDFNPNPSKEFIEQARANYIRQQQEAYTKRYHTPPDADTFKRQMMTILHQVQDTQEVLESSQEHLFTLMEHKLTLLTNQTGKIGQIQNIMSQLQHLLKETKRTEEEAVGPSGDEVINTKRLVERVNSIMAQLVLFDTTQETNLSAPQSRHLLWRIGPGIFLFFAVFLLVFCGVVGWAGKDERKWQ